MELVEINKEEFNNLAKNFTCKNFFQTSNMGESLYERGKKVYYLGLKENNIMQAITMIYEGNTFLGKKEFICLKGFLCDYNNHEVVKEFSMKLLDFVTLHGGFKLTIDPYINEVERDIDGKIVENGNNNYEVIKF